MSDELIVPPVDEIELPGVDEVPPFAEVIPAETAPAGSPQALLDEAKAKCLPGESAEAHEDHKAQLEIAYLAFSGQRTGDSNQQNPGPDSLESHVVVTSEDPS